MKNDGLNGTSYASLTLCQGGKKKSLNYKFLFFLALFVICVLFSYVSYLFYDFYTYNKEMYSQLQELEEAYDKVNVKYLQVQEELLKCKENKNFPVARDL